MMVLATLGHPITQRRPVQVWSTLRGFVGNDSSKAGMLCIGSHQLMRALGTEVLLPCMEDYATYLENAG